MPEELNNDRNRRVLEYLSGTSAHGDTAEALQNAVASLGAASLYCPNPAEYRYVAAFTNQTVFGLASGMGRIAFRLAPDMAKRALQTGGTAVAELSPEPSPGLRSSMGGDYRRGLYRSCPGEKVARKASGASS